jgi:hypothetical protein
VLFRAGPSAVPSQPEKYLNPRPNLIQCLKLAHHFHPHASRCILKGNSVKLASEFVNCK